VTEDERDGAWHHLAIAAPSILLVIFAFTVAAGLDSDPVKVFLLVALAAAFCNEERVRYQGRKEAWRGRRGRREAGI
jgi:hypothetical protein